MNKSGCIFIRELLFLHSALWAADVTASAPAAILENEDKGHWLGVAEQRDGRNHLHGVAIPACIALLWTSFTQQRNKLLSCFGCYDFRILSGVSDPNPFEYI